MYSIRSYIYFVFWFALMNCFRVVFTINNATAINYYHKNLEHTNVSVCVCTHIARVHFVHMSNTSCFKQQQRLLVCTENATKTIQIIKF